MKFIHTTLQVSDYQKSLDFYSNKLGLPIAEEFGTKERPIAMLGTDTKIEIIGDGIGKIDYPQISMGFETTDVVEKARELDPNFEGPFSPNSSIRFCFIRDPDGYRVQLLEYLNKD